MKKIVLVLFLFTSFITQAGGFRFPNISYAYAKLYLFNTEVKQVRNINYHIYKNGRYADSKIGNGTLLSDAFHEKLEKALKKGVDELIMGLGKCYMPRHGIIYYNASHQPVASMSICFECDRIGMWSKNEMRFSEDYEHFDFKKAEKQIANLAQIIRAENILVYTSSADEKKYKHTYQSKPFNGVERKNIKANKELQNFSQNITSNTVKTWKADNTRRVFNTGKDSTIIVENSTIEFTELLFGDKSKFTFHNSNLITAKIFNSEILLPIGISIGMSAKEVYQKFNYSMPSNSFPKILVISSENWSTKLSFRYNTLIAIELTRK